MGNRIATIAIRFDNISSTAVVEFVLALSSSIPNSKFA